MTAQQRRSRRVSRRRHRVEAQGPARRHWERRRAGQANSAPQLRYREIGDDADAMLHVKRPPSMRNVARYVAGMKAPTSTRPDDYRPRPGRKAKKYRRG